MPEPKGTDEIKRIEEKARNLIKNEGVPKVLERLGGKGGELIGKVEITVPDIHLLLYNKKPKTVFRAEEVKYLAQLYRPMVMAVDAAKGRMPNIVKSEVIEGLNSAEDIFDLQGEEKTKNDFQEFKKHIKASLERDTHTALQELDDMFDTIETSLAKVGGVPRFKIKGLLIKGQIDELVKITTK